MNADPIRPDCESCGGDAVTNRYDEHNGWQPICTACAAAPRCDGCDASLDDPDPADGITYCPQCGHPNHVTPISGDAER